MILELAALGLLGVASLGRSTPPPAPYGALPSRRQVEHSKLETYAFLHFSPNTFTNREWGLGDEDPNVFNPDQFDPDQIVLSLKAGGMKGAILTCKHHDGFCLWPTKTTDHSIASSSWMGGHGDVVKAISDACHRHGLKFGIYVSPWDRNNAHYGKPEYVDIYRNQLHELLTQYGPIFEVWHDGANGGDGYYGGARETRSIDRSIYYGWPVTWAMVRKLQPDACVFTDVGPDLRWVGNESGYAAPTSWATYDPVAPEGKQPAPGLVEAQYGETGTLDGHNWIPAECDVSIRPGWFWHESENSHVKSLKQLADLYFRSVGRGASFLLNIPPNRHGKLQDEDVARLKEFGSFLHDTFGHNLAAGATCAASNVRGNDSRFSAANLISSREDRYYATDDDQTAPAVELNLKSAETFDVIRLREAIQLGQRVRSFAVDVWDETAGQWKEIADATSVGSCRLIRLPSPVTAHRIRIRVTKSPVCVALYDFGLFLAKD